LEFREKHFLSCFLRNGEDLSMQVVLAMFRADGDRRSFSLHKDQTVVGRREDCDLRIPLGEISRKHCRFVNDGEALRVEDMGSSNGTYHNGQRVQEAIIHPGDTVQVGSIAFVIQIDGVPGDDELHPVLAQKGSSEETGTPAADDSEESDVNGKAVAKGEEEHAGAEAVADGEGNAGEEFDPMKFLQAGDSQNAGSAIALDLDNSNAGDPLDEA
jgi:predicted component of type VI protein secretion system